MIVVDPVGWGNPELSITLEKIKACRDDAANQRALNILLSGDPVLVDIATAGEVIPNMTRNTILHAGPPVTWSKMAGPMRGAILGTLILEGLANDLTEAERVVESGDITFSPCHHHQAVGPMAGMISYSTPVFVVENRTVGNRAFCDISDAGSIRFGANGPEAINKLKWLRKIFFPALRQSLHNLNEPIALKALQAEALCMGDEGHNRHRAGSLLFLSVILPGLLAINDLDTDDRCKIINYIINDEIFFLNLTMAMGKVCLDAAEGIPGSTMVTTMARNGVEFGIRISGLPGQWFTAPAPVVKGRLLKGLTEDDCSLDMGDSAVVETFGIGGFALSGAPSILEIVGGTVGDALSYTTKMYGITLSENPVFRIPALDFRGTPTGIDLCKVVEKSQLPVIDTGIAHKQPGVGIIGFGIVYAPKECFEKALNAFASTYT
jgi:hypothetical protein